MRKTLTDFKSLDDKIEQQSAEVQVVAELVKSLVKENASTVQSQETYLKRYEDLTKRYGKQGQNENACKMNVHAEVSETRLWHFTYAR